MRKIVLIAGLLFGNCFAVIQSQKSSDYSDVCVVTLSTVYNNQNFMDDFVYSLSEAGKRSGFPIINVFRIDSSLEESPGSEDLAALSRSLAKFPLREAIIKNNEQNMGCCCTRCILLRDDLGELICSNEYVSSAKSKGKLFYCFLDSDDIIHPDMLRILVDAAESLSAQVVCAERTVVQFDQFQLDRLDQFYQHRELNDFELIQDNLPKGDEMVTSPGKLACTPYGFLTVEPRSSTENFGYVSMLFRYAGQFYSMPLDTMHSLYYDLESPKFLLDQKDDENPVALYFYRQHKDSDLHRNYVEEIASGELFEEIESGSLRAEVFLFMLIDCGLELLDSRLNEVRTSRPDLKPTIDEQMDKAKKMKDELERRTLEFRTKRLQDTEKTHMLGDSW